MRSRTRASFRRMGELAAGGTRGGRGRQGARGDPRADRRGFLALPYPRAGLGDAPRRGADPGTQPGLHRPRDGPVLRRAVVGPGSSPPLAFGAGGAAVASGVCADRALFGPLETARPAGACRPVHYEVLRIRRTSRGAARPRARGGVGAQAKGSGRGCLVVSLFFRTIDEAVCGAVPDGDAFPLAPDATAPCSGGWSASWCGRRRRASRATCCRICLGSRSLPIITCKCGGLVGGLARRPGVYSR